jgi:uncharacterized protein YegP (UPF0339 family)
MGKSKKVVLGCAVLFCVASFVTGCAAESPAEGESAGAAAAQTARVGKAEIFQGIESQWYFRVVAANNEIVLRSEGYASKSNAQRGATTALGWATDASRFEDRATAAGDAYFVVKASNGEIVGTSQVYS